MERIKRMVQFILPGDQFDEHANKLVEYDRKYQEQEERLNNARIAVLEGRFRVRYGVAAEHELMEQLNVHNSSK